VRPRKLPISEITVQQYVKVATKLGKSEFTASTAGLESFRKRPQIVFNEVCGEACDVCEETVVDLVPKLCSVTDGYDPKCIANGDETGLFFRALTRKTMCLKDERYSGNKLCK
jgi:hypothetical protein